ncbi:MAG: hypothetical protein Ta2G_05770 [Termitinemataceae bacterium]|nr:MAG: hypothetical protein Ta2G_05770 [Termitinemataceae bacterium]
MPNTKISFIKRLVLWRGVLRRQFLFWFNKKYIEMSKAKRSGECLRCGSCCRLFFSSCPYLKYEDDGKSSCTKYGPKRLPNCITFPIDHKDIKDRNIISKTPCGYEFNA